jgi:tetraacyldisaccharide 4'-kinase
MFSWPDRLPGMRSAIDRLSVGLEGKPGPGREVAAALFGLALRARQAAFARGLVRTQRVEGVKVVSVGSLRVGGAGKTPLALYLAQRLSDRGLATALLLRGYRGQLERSGGLVSRGSGPLVNARQAGDEAFQAARRLRGVQVRVGADRIASARAARRAGARVVVLDDGFQHRVLQRDLDLLLVCPQDFARQTGLLPAGPLREPPAAALRADLLVGLSSDWPGATDRVKVLVSHVPRCLVTVSGQELELAFLGGKRVHLLSGIERPQRFAAVARASDCQVVGRSFFPDHHYFSAGELQDVLDRARAEKAEIVLTTEKDLSRPVLWGQTLALPLLALRLELEIACGAALLERALEVISGPDRRR